MGVQACCSGAISQVNLHKHAHLFTGKRVHDLHPGHRQLGQQLDPAMRLMISPSSSSVTEVCLGRNRTTYCNVVLATPDGDVYAVLTKRAVKEFWLLFFRLQEDEVE